MVMRSPEPVSAKRKSSRTIEYTHVSHKPGHGSIFHMGLMLIDGIGLGMIAVCTVFEGVEDYYDALVGSSKENPETILCFICGLILATLGLLFLIFHAASFEAVHDFEHIGMAMLTIAPIVNMCGWNMFDSGLDPTHFYNTQWMATEIVEFIGMALLCISFIDADRHTVLAIELTGFLMLMVAAMFTINLYSDRILPEFIIRLDHIHIFDTCGLLLLCVVSCGQWHMKGLTIEYEHKHPTLHRNRTHSGQHLSPPTTGHMHDVEKGGEYSLTRRAVDEFGNAVHDSDV